MEQNITWQPRICPQLPEVHGSTEFSEFKSLLAGIDRQLKDLGLEKRLIYRSIQRLQREHMLHLVGHRRARLIQQRSLALRCTLARRLLGRSLRQFHVDLAQSWLLQSFVGIFDAVFIRIPSKSQLERFEKWFCAEDLEEVLRLHVNRILEADLPITDDPASPVVTIDRIYADSTCVQANIHHPVDWVMVRDAGRSLLKTIQTIRRHGLRHRIPNPKHLLRKLNRLCLRMSHASRQKHGKRKRKHVLRALKRHLHLIAEHGQRYAHLVREKWFVSTLSHGWAEHLIKRLDDLLDLIPHVIWQAHERIIGERKVSNRDKLLSLYEDHIHVLIRGKAGAEVEFGNGLYLAEQEQGLLVDWSFIRDQPPADSRLVEPSLRRMRTHYPNHTVKAYCADRGFDSKTNAWFLENVSIANAICPRRPSLYHKRHLHDQYRTMQARRGQTEARIGIIRNVFLGGVVKSKSFEHRKLTVLWSILTHNLWLIARLKRKKKRILKAA